ncbi:phosphate transport system permease protein PstA [Verrucomicrobiota bacterium]|nr:phosphate transport system permease protein PstA [Verrucomicrobiota bacterium]
MSSVSTQTPVRGFRSRGFDFGSFVFTGVTGLATLFILAILAIIIANVVWHGWSTFSWRFLTGSAGQDMFDVNKAGILPMLIGTTLRVLMMTVFVVPIGVITAVYLTEYAHNTALTTRIIRGAVNNLAGVPSIVFGLFGLGFFISFLGGTLDSGATEPHWGKPAILWASLTLAVMTLPLVIVATEESLRAITPGLREASLALGATKLETILKIVLPEALPGILTGGILAVGRAGGEVAPILFTGAAYYMRDLPHSLTDQFMDLGYHVFILSTQSPDIEKTRPILFATVLALLLLTLSLNLIAVIVRARVRKRMRGGH